MKTLHIACTVLVTCVISTVAARADNIQTLIEQGDDQLQADHLEKATELFKQAVAANPLSSAAHQRLGHALSLSGDLNAALDEERQAINLDPKNGEAHCNMGWIFGLQQRYRAAIEEEKLAILLDPGNSSAYSILGLSLASIEDYDLAVSAFNKAIALAPDDFNSYMNLAAALGRKKDYRSAVTMYQRAIDLNKGNASAYLGLGAALGKLGDLNGQVQAYKQAVALSPGNPVHHGRLGYAYSQLGDWRAALREGSIANGLRLERSSNEFFKMFLTTWAAIFVVFGVLFAVIFSGSRFKPQRGETVVKSFFLTFYRDKPGRFVLTNRRLVFVPEAFSTWFGSTRVSMELDQVSEVESHTTMSGGRLSILSSNGSVHQFTMPNLVLEPLTKQLKALAAAHKANIESSSVSISQESLNTMVESMKDEVAPELSFDPFANNIDEKDAVIITIVSNETDRATESSASIETQSQNAEAPADLPTAPEELENQSSSPESLQTKDESKSETEDEPQTEHQSEAEKGSQAADLV